MFIQPKIQCLHLFPSSPFVYIDMANKLFKGQGFTYI